MNNTLNYTRLSAVCGLSSSYISRVLRGKANPTFKSLSLIADALHVETSDLLHKILTSKEDSNG